MLWEAVFLLLVLKIPLVYLGVVVWWAIRAEPRPEEPALVVTVADTPPSLTPSVPPERRPRRLPERSGPRRRPPRGRLATMHDEARR